MRLKRTRILRAALALALAIPLAVPSPALAYATDGYEGGAGDDTWQTARNITSSIDTAGTYGYLSEPMSEESHTFDAVDDVVPASDEDWVKFTVDSIAVESGHGYTIEAQGLDPLVDPVIEVYGPGTPMPTAPGDLGPDPVTPDLTSTDPNAFAANDDGPWFARQSASLSFLPDVAGTYHVRIRPYYLHAASSYLPTGFRDGVGRYTLRVKAGQMSRLAGATRIETAIAISKERFGLGSSITTSAVIATAYNFADALSGSTLAGALRSPILLTAKESLSPGVLTELDRLGVDTVYVLGGEAAVGPAVETSLENAGLSVVRIAGSNRTATARKVAEEAARVGASAPTSFTIAPVAFVANSRNYPDALAASPMATFNVAPVLLTNADTLDPEAAAALADPALGITDVVIVGGTSVVSNQVQTQISTLLGGSNHVRRIAGTSRWETARDFATWATGVRPASATGFVGTPANPGALATLDFNRVGVASGRNFPDALAGGVFCGLSRAPIMLTEPDRVPDPLLDVIAPIGNDYWYASDLAILRSYVFGGTAAVSTSVHLLLDTFTGYGAPLSD